MNFQDKAIVVTGGASGIGLCVVKKLLALGATVHVMDMADKIPDDFDSQGKVFFYPNIDVSSRPAVAQAFKAVSERSPTLHGLLNSAGIIRFGRAGCDDDETMDKIMAVNFTGTWNACTEFFKYAAKVDREKVEEIPRDADVCIVNMSSMAGVKGYPGASAYCSSKHAVAGLTKTLAIEWAPVGIRVNALAPGLVDTPMGQSVLDEARSAEHFKMPMRNLLQADEIADTILFMMSPQSSGFVGAIVQVNGGK